MTMTASGALVRGNNAVKTLTVKVGSPMRIAINGESSLRTKKHATLPENFDG